MTIKSFTLLFLTLGLLQDCNSLEPPLNDTAISLSLEDVSSIEAWLNLSAINLQLPATVILKQNDQPRSTIILDKPDTLLFVDSLLPNTTYSFQASSSQPQVSGNLLQVKTMDTTSHNFNWQTWTFGDPGISSVLHDVAILDDNDIWAVGEIYLNDSTGQIDSKAYGILKWTGESWYTERITSPGTNSIPANLTPEGIYPVGEKSVWLVSGGVHYLNNNNILSYWINYWPGNDSAIFSNGQWLDKIWAISKYNVFVVGYSGAIAHFDGTSWKRIDANTNGNFLDIYGVDDNVFCPISFAHNTNLSHIIKINQNYIVEYLDFDKEAVYSVWTNTGFPLYASGSGIYENKQGIWNEVNFGEGYLKRMIRGNNLNDIFVIGALGFVGHYNGQTWYQYNELELSSNLYSSVSIKGDLVVIVGRNDSKGLIIVGRRN